MAADQANFLQLLNSTLSTDNAVRQQAEDAYNSLPRDVKITHLLGAIHQHQQPEEVRQIAAVLLRRLFSSEFQEFYKEENIWNYFKHVLDEGSTADRFETLTIIKNAVIGSNRQKGVLIEHNMLPQLIKISLSRNPDELELKINALIIIGSLARGSIEQITTLIKNFNITQIMASEIFDLNNNKKCVEICLSTLKSICDIGGATHDDITFIGNPNDLAYLLSLGGPENSLKTQACATSLLVTFCKNYENQLKLLNAGAINMLTRMISTQIEYIQLPALNCLTCMCYENRSVADTCCVTSYHGKSLPDILNALMSRLCSPEIQLTAAKSLTNVYRAGTLPHTDHRIMRKTLPTLTRLCTDTYKANIRAKAAETLAYLTELNSDLQHVAAISNNLLKSLFQLVQSDDDYSKKSGLKCFASLGANDEAIRKRIIEAHGLIEAIVESLNESNADVKLAALKSLLSLSRSVHQLRTTFQDYSIWKPLMELINNEQTDMELLIAATSIICNLVLEFSPSKLNLLKSDIIEKLCSYLNHQEYALRLNSIWALMNMSYNADKDLTNKILSTLTSETLENLLKDNDKCILMKSLAFIRNMICSPNLINLFIYKCMTYNLNLLDVLVDILESSNMSSDIKEQVLCIFGNIAADSGNPGYIVNHNRILISISKFLKSSDYPLQAGALYVFNNIIQNRSLSGYDVLAKLNIIESLYDLSKSLQPQASSTDFIVRSLNEILEKCNSFSNLIGETADNSDNIRSSDSTLSSGKEFDPPHISHKKNR